MQKRAFTLIEIMVSLGIFSLVMVVALGALLKILDVNKRAQTIKASVNNINFTLETMSREMRVGTNFRTPVAGVPSDTIFFLGEVAGSGCPTHYSYRLLRSGSQSTIQRGVRTPSSQPCTVTSYPYSDMTSPDVYISNLEFDVKNFASMPYATIKVNGEIGLVDKTKSEFFIQTAVSQRLSN